MALGAVHIANDNTLAKLLTLPSYYTDLLFAFAFVYAVGFYIRGVVRYLDHRADWSLRFKGRLKLQFALGVLTPCIFLLITESAYLVWGLNIPLGESSIAYLELPVTFVFLVIINLCYYVLFLRGQHTIPATVLTKTYAPFIVSKGYQQKAILPDEVAYFYIDEGLTFLCTQKNERFVVSESLESLENKTNPSDFFKLNRQVLAARWAISTVENTPTRKLRIELTPVFKDEQFVSKANASTFQKWWRSSVPASN